MKKPLLFILVTALFTGAIMVIQAATIVKRWKLPLVIEMLPVFFNVPKSTIYTPQKQAHTRICALFPSLFATLCLASGSIPKSRLTLPEALGSLRIPALPKAAA